MRGKKMKDPYYFYNENDIMAILIRDNYSSEGIEFFTDTKYSQQLAFMHHGSGHIIAPHIHNHIERQIFNTQEVLVIRKGRLRIDFYNDDKDYLKSAILREGDIIMLVSGGHGFEMLEETEMFEIKQGPYLGDLDKDRFENKDINICYEEGFER